MTSVSLSFFLNFATSISDASLSSSSVVSMLIKPQTKFKQIAYVDYISPNFVGRVSSPKHRTFHVLHSSNAAFADLYAAVRRYFRDDYDQSESHYFQSFSHSLNLVLNRLQALIRKTSSFSWTSFT